MCDTCASSQGWHRGTTRTANARRVRPSSGTPRHVTHLHRHKLAHDKLQHNKGAVQRTHRAADDVIGRLKDQRHYNHAADNGGQVPAYVLTHKEHGTVRAANAQARGIKKAKSTRLPPPHQHAWGPR